MSSQVHVSLRSARIGEEIAGRNLWGPSRSTILVRTRSRSGLEQKPHNDRGEQQTGKKQSAGLKKTRGSVNRVRPATPAKNH